MSEAREPSLNEVLHFDPLYEAEQMTGERYGGGVGFGLMQAHSRLKRRMLTERDDTTLNNDLRTYLRIVRDMGFESVGEYDFAGRAWADESPTTERFYIMAHRKWAAMLCFDTYRETQVNGGHIYYQWRPLEGVERPHAVTSSGGWRNYPDVWVGYHDCREAIRHNMRGLDNFGTWINPWKADTDPFLWLHGHNEIPDYEGCDFDTRLKKVKEIVRNRIAAMPDWAREMFEPAIPAV